MADPVFDTILPQAAREGMELSFAVTATDLDASTPTLSIVSFKPQALPWLGAAPASYRLESGIFYWTPSIGALAKSPFELILRATDADDITGNTYVDYSVLITVVAAPLAKFDGQDTMVHGFGTRWLTTARRGAFFYYPQADELFIVAEVYSDTLLSLDHAPPTFEVTTTFSLSLEFTPRYHLPVPALRDLNKAAIASAAVLKIDAVLAALNARTDILAGGPAERGALLVAADGYLLLEDGESHLLL